MKKTFLMLLVGFIVLDVAFGPRGCNRDGSGTLSGVVSFSGLNCQPGQPDFNIPPCSGPYPNYKIEVFREDGKTIALTAMTDAKGAFNIDLPNGSYVIYTQNGPMENNRATHAVKISGGKDQRLDLNVSTGIQ